MDSEIVKLLGKIAGAGEMKANIIQFDSEDAGIEHAKRLVTLKPGDIIYSGMDGKKSQKFVFMGPCVEDGRARGICVDDGHLVTALLAWGSVRFEPDAEME